MSFEEHTPQCLARDKGSVNVNEVIVTSSSCAKSEHLGKKIRVFSELAKTQGTNLGSGSCAKPCGWGPPLTSHVVVLP